MKYMAIGKYQSNQIINWGLRALSIVGALTILAGFNCCHGEGSPLVQNIGIISCLGFTAIALVNDIHTAYMYRKHEKIEGVRFKHYFALEAAKTIFSPLVAIGVASAIGMGCSPSGGVGRDADDEGLDEAILKRFAKA